MILKPMRPPLPLILRHAARAQRPRLLTLLIGALIAVLVLCALGNSWWAWAEPVIALVTLAVAVIIWYGEAAEDWEESLPKRLTAEFWFAEPGRSERLVMVCRHAPLADEGDIRSWAIALGGQMDCGKRTLKYRPDFLLDPPEIVLGPDGAPCRHYRIRFTLDELPDRLTQLQVEKGYLCRVTWTLDNGQRKEELQRAEFVN